MIRSFDDEATLDIFNGLNSKRARSRLDVRLFPVAMRKLDMIGAASCLKDLKIPPSNYLEALKGELKGWHSIRINDQYRIIFRWVNDAAEDVNIVDYH